MSKKGKKIVVKGVDIKKATLAGGVFFGLIGLVGSILLALGLAAPPVFLLPMSIGALGGIVLIIAGTAVSAIMGAINGFLLSVFLNYALKVSDGFDIQADY